ncbi:MAG: Rieske (2Fe-2S) protein [Myxococcales bacterium]|nr:Rieske (2Fe-2S) protein [Myxococcales bacterium]
MSTTSLGLGRPSGWYFVRRSDELRPGQLVSRRFFGRDLIVYRTESGRVVATEPYCPHLGAHFGHGGRVEGEELRCPFHGFRFDTEGGCVSTPYGFKAPPKARVQVHKTHEVHGMILVWFDELGREPWFDVPDYDMRGWPAFKTKTFDLRSHPQETTENSVDIGHLTVVHGFKNVRVVEDLRTDGPYLTARYGMDRDATVFGRPGGWFKSEFTVHVHGLGYSKVDVDIDELAMRTRQIVMPTPTEDDRIDLTIGMSIKLEEPTRLSRVLAVVPKWLTTKIALELGMLGYSHDVAQDFDVWQNKIYVETPMLAKGDGPIGLYRRWCRQFYADAQTNEPRERQQAAR